MTLVEALDKQLLRSYDAKQCYLQDLLWWETVQTSMSYKTSSFSFRDDLLVLKMHKIVHDNERFSTIFNKISFEG